MKLALSGNGLNSFSFLLFGFSRKTTNNIVKYDQQVTLLCIYIYIERERYDINKSSKPAKT